MILASEFKDDFKVNSSACVLAVSSRRSVDELSVKDREVTFWQSQGMNLLSQQIWCWGQDIEHPSGNLLVQHGFQRYEKPQGSRLPSLYRLDISPTARIILRGFGVFYGDDRWGGLFLRRYRSSLQLTPAAELARPAWKSEDLPQLVEPELSELAWSQRLLLELIEWIRQYEVWIAETQGITYRREALQPWNSKAIRVVPAEAMASAWRLLGFAIADDSQRLLPQPQPAGIKAGAGNPCIESGLTPRPDQLRY